MCTVLYKNLYILLYFTNFCPLTPFSGVFWGTLPALTGVLEDRHLQLPEFWRNVTCSYRSLGGPLPAIIGNFGGPLFELTWNFGRPLSPETSDFVEKRQKVIFNHFNGAVTSNIRYFKLVSFSVFGLSKFYESSALTRLTRCSSWSEMENLAYILI